MLTYIYRFIFVRLICSICCVLSTMFASNKTKMQYNTIEGGHSLIFSWRCLGPCRSRVEVRAVEAVDGLLWRRFDTSASVQPDRQSQVHLLHTLSPEALPQELRRSAPEQGFETTTEGSRSTSQGIHIPGASILGVGGRDPQHFGQGGRGVTGIVSGSWTGRELLL